MIQSNHLRREFHANFYLQIGFTCYKFIIHFLNTVDQYFNLITVYFKMIIQQMPLKEYDAGLEAWNIVLKTISFLRIQGTAITDIHFNKLYVQIQHP